MTPTPTPTRNQRSRRSMLTAGGLAVAVGGGLLFAAPWPMGAGRTDASVVSVEREPAYQDRGLLALAMALPNAAAYVRAGFASQRNASFCGPTTALNVERSLGKDDDQDHVLEGTGVRSILGYVWGGLTLDEEAALLRQKTGRRATVLRDLDLARFRQELARANDPGLRYVVNFARGPLFGRGGGHHSPVGGYLPDRDLVLVLDVNASYRPWLVTTARLFEAADTYDPKTHQKRGLIRIE
ncbi:MAG: phytochelatin synthase family protein [Anaeromyxobacteraceae bacterium]